MAVHGWNSPCYCIRHSALEIKIVDLESCKLYSTRIHAAHQVLSGSWRAISRFICTPFIFSLAKYFHSSPCILLCLNPWMIVSKILTLTFASHILSVPPVFPISVNGKHLLSICLCKTNHGPAFLHEIFSQPFLFYGEHHQLQLSKL